MMHAMLFALAISTPVEDTEVHALYAASVVDADLYGDPKPRGLDGFLPPPMVDEPVHLGPPWIAPHIVYAWRDRNGTSYLIVSDILGNKLIAIHRFGDSSWGSLSFNSQQLGD